MRLPFETLSLAIAILSPLVKASSSIRNPIGTLSAIRNATIHTHNHRVTALSQFDLTFSIRDDLDVRFSLEPNHDIIADGATVSYLAPDGSIEQEEAIDRLVHKVFKGSAWVRSPRTGRDEWQRVGWARTLIRKDGEHPQFEGAFSAHHDHHHIQSSRNYMQTRHPLDPMIDELDDGKEYMVVWRDSDIIRDFDQLAHQELRRDLDSDVPTCQADVLDFNLNPNHPVYLGILQRSTDSYGVMDLSRLFGKRQIDSTTGGNSAGTNLVSTIGSTFGCPTTNKVALVGVATDCSYTQEMGTDQALRENVITQMNTASALWENSFKISLGLANLTISPAECPGNINSVTMWNQDCTADLDIQGRLNYFSAWRGTQPDHNSHWTLFSTCNTGSAVGLAWLGQACVNTAYSSNQSFTGNGGTSGTQTETVSGANVIVRTQGANEWQIVAHETGHTYGAVHDCTSQTCADPNFVSSQQCCPLSANTCDAGEQYIMNPSTAAGITSFSPCSIGNICSAIGRRSVNTDCLSDNKNINTITGQQCGNGIVEQGEDCDCGGTEGCGDDSCCDPTTCTFKDGAVCDDANEECCSGCQYRSQGSVCRASTSSCDPQEVCSGTSGNCPADKTAPDGQNCGDGLQCASGQCTSRDQQCKTAMGTYTRGNDTHACDSEGCVISCASPEFGYGVCYGLQQNFLDGTECGGGGHCQNGQCLGSSFGGEVKSWITDHKEIVIGICAAVGALILLAILGCLRNCYRRRKMRKQMPSPPPNGWGGWQQSRGPQPRQQGWGQPPQMEQNWYGPPPPSMSGGRGHHSQGWPAPPMPPATYGGQNRGPVMYG